MRIARTRAPVLAHRAVGDQVVRRGIGDDGGDDVPRPDVGARRGEVHQPAVACASGHPGGATVLATFPDGHQQLDGVSYLSGVLLQRDSLLKIDESLIALLDDRFGQLAVELGRRRSGSLRILERERRAEARGGDDVEGVLEVLLGLAGEADDQVGGDGGVRDG